METLNIGVVCPFPPSCVHSTIFSACQQSGQQRAQITWWAREVICPTGDAEKERLVTYCKMKRGNIYVLIFQRPRKIATSVQVSNSIPTWVQFKRRKPSVAFHCSSTLAIASLFSLNVVCVILWEGLWHQIITEGVNCVICRLLSWIKLESDKLSLMMWGKQAGSRLR